MKNVIVYFIVLIGVFIFPNNVYGEYYTGNDFYILYKSENYNSKLAYTSYLTGFFMYCQLYDDNCLVPIDIKYKKFHSSFGLFLEREVDLRHLSINILLKMWELSTFTDKNFKEIRDEILRQMVIP